MRNIEILCKSLLLGTIIFTHAPFAKNKNIIMDASARFFQTIIPGLSSIFSQQLSNIAYSQYTYECIKRNLLAEYQKHSIVKLL